MKSTFVRKKTLNSHCLKHTHTRTHTHAPVVLFFFLRLQETYFSNSLSVEGFSVSKSISISSGLEFFSEGSRDWMMCTTRPSLSPGSLLMSKLSWRFSSYDMGLQRSPETPPNTPEREERGERREGREGRGRERRKGRERAERR